MLEKMGEFFDSRLSEYDQHQLTCIDSAEEFYDFTARCLPNFEGARILDLGCGTGLELEEYFTYNPLAKITGVDLAPGMLEKLKNKFSEKNIKLILGSYFDVDFESEFYDAAVSVESLHHFNKKEKIPLYKKILKTLKPGGFFILTDYFASSDEEEIFYKNEFNKIKKREKINDNEFYHYDTPLTIEHEIEALYEGGFNSVKVLYTWGSTSLIKASK